MVITSLALTLALALGGSAPAAKPAPPPVPPPPPAATKPATAPKAGPAPTTAPTTTTPTTPKNKLPSSSLTMTPPPDDGKRRILVLPVEVRGRDTKKFHAAVHAAVQRGLERGEYKMVPADPKTKCTTHACAGEAAAAAKVDFAVRVTIDAADRVYHLSIAVIAADGSRLVAYSKDECDLCGLEEVVQMIDEQSASIRARLDALVTEPPVIAFESAPPGATIELDGQTIGPAPLEHTPVPGAHRARAILDGYATQERRFTAVVGVREVVRFELQALGRKDRRPLMRALGWSALGIGLGATGVGAALIVIDHDPVTTRCNGSNVDPDGDCRYIYLTKNAGIGLVATGAALLVTSVALLVAGHAKKRPSKIKRR
jgi:hypothetical protein